MGLANFGVAGATAAAGLFGPLLDRLNLSGPRDWLHGAVPGRGARGYREYRTDPRAAGRNAIPIAVAARMSASSCSLTARWAKVDHNQDHN